MQELSGTAQKKVVHLNVRPKFQLDQPLMPLDFVASPNRTPDSVETPDNIADLKRAASNVDSMEELATIGGLNTLLLSRRGDSVGR